MHKTVQNLISIQSLIKSKLTTLNNKDKIPKIIAVSKTFKIENIMPLIDYGHLDYGENKVQEALNKWADVKNQNEKIKLHLIGRLQTNKVKQALTIFDYIHSLDSEKLAKKIAEEQQKQNVKPKKGMHKSENRPLEPSQGRALCLSRKSFWIPMLFEIFTNFTNFV